MGFTFLGQFLFFLSFLCLHLKFPLFGARKMRGETESTEFSPSCHMMGQIVCVCVGEGGSVLIDIYYYNYVPYPNAALRE